MINNQTLIQRSEEWVKNNFQYSVYIGNNDVSNLVKSLTIETTALNDEIFEPITGQLSLVLNGDQRSLFENSVIVKVFLHISENETLQVFAGIADIQTQATFSDIRSETAVKVFDFTHILKKKKIQQQFYENVVFCDNTNTGVSLLHILLSQAGLQNTIAVADNNKTYPVAVIKEGTLYDAVVNACASIGCSFDYSTGFFRIINIAHDLYTPVYTINKTESLKIERLPADIKNPVVVGYDIQKQTGALVYIITYKASDSVQECYIPIPAGSYYPNDGFIVAEVESEDIIHISNPTFSIATASGGNVSAENVSVEGKKIKFRLKNNTAGEQTVVKCRIYADVVKIVKETISGETINTQNPENKHTWADNYFIDGFFSATLANRIAQRWKARHSKYTIDTYYLPFLEIGDIVTFQDDFSNTVATCFVHSLKHYISPSSQKTTAVLINVEAVQTGATSEINLVQVPQDINLINAQSSVSLQEVMETLSPTNTQGYEGQGWTTTPVPPTIKSLRTRNNFITLEITPQENLSNFDRYEYQISKDNGGTWTNLAGTQGQVEISYLDTWQFIVSWNTDSDGKAIDTQIKIRVRRVTKADIYSDWSYTDNITLQASISAITNNLGQVYCDSVIFDAYNYIGPSAFRLGGVSSYIQYAGGDLSLQGAGIDVGGGNIEVSGDITAGGNISANTVTVAGKQIIILDPTAWYYCSYQEGGNIVLYDSNGNKLLQAYIANNPEIQCKYIHNIYLDNANYVSDNIQLTYGQIAHVKGIIGYGILSGSPFIAQSSTPPSSYTFRKLDGIIEPHESLVISMPSYYARIGVGETMQVDMSWSSNNGIRYIPLQMQVGDIYKIETLLVSGITNDILLQNCFNTAPNATITQYFVLDPNNGLMRSWNSTTTPRFLTTGFFTGAGGGVPNVMIGYLRVIDQAILGGNLHYRFSASFQSQLKEWQTYFINSWGWLRAFNYLSVQPSLVHTANLSVLITRLR